MRSSSPLAAVAATVVAFLAASAPAGAAPEPPRPCAAPGDGADGSSLLDLATYRIHTVFRKPDGTEIERTVPAVAILPALVNVNSAGFGIPDIAVALLPTPGGGARLSVTKLPLAPADMPLLVEAQIDVAQDLDVSFGYDAREGVTTGSPGDAPRTFGAGFHFAFSQPHADGAQGTRDELALDVDTGGAGPALALIAEARNTAEPDRTAARARFAPVPSELGLEAQLACRELTQTADVHLDAATPAVVDAKVTDDGVEQGTRRTTVARATVDQLPSAVDVKYTDERAARRQTVKTSSSAAIGRLDVSADQLAPDGATIATQGRAIARGVPPDGLTAVLERHGPEAEETRLKLDAAPGTSIGSVEGGFATGRPVALLDNPAQFFAPGELGDGEQPGYGFIDGDDAAVRLANLRRALVDTADPTAPEAQTLRVEAGSSAQPFLVRQRLGQRTVNGRVLDLPADVALTVADGSKQVVRYTGSDRIDRIRVDAHDPDGLVSDPFLSVAQLDVRGVPRCLELVLPGDGLEATTARGARPGCDTGTIGTLEALATSGAPGSPSAPEFDDQLAAGEDGVSLRTGTGNVLFARMTDLRSARFAATETLTPSARDDLLEAELKHGAALTRPFAIKVETGSLRQYLDATLATVPRDLSLTVRNRQTNAPDSAFDVDWDASAAVAPFGGRNGLELDTNLGDHDLPAPQEGQTIPGDPNMNVTIPTLPASVSACVATFRGCGGVGPALDSQLRLDASQMMELRLFDCRDAGFDGDCEAGFVDKTDRQESAFADIERVRSVELEADIPPIRGGIDGRLLLDTTQNGVTHQLDGEGRDLFLSSRSDDPCADPGEASLLDGSFDRVSANRRIMVFEIGNLGCQPTDPNVKSLVGTMRCGSGFRLDANPGGPFGRLDNDICTDRI